MAVEENVVAVEEREAKTRAEAGPDWRAGRRRSSTPHSIAAEELEESLDAHKYSTRVVRNLYVCATKVRRLETMENAAYVGDTR